MFCQDLGADDRMKRRSYDHLSTVVPFIDTVQVAPAMLIFLVFCQYLELFTLVLLSTPLNIFFKSRHCTWLSN